MSLEDDPQTIGDAASTICESCGAELLGAKFCPECAAPLKPAPPGCQECGSQPEVITNFCPECGAKMPLIG